MTTIFPGVIVSTHRLTKISNGEPLNDDDLKTDGIKVKYQELTDVPGNKGVFLCDIKQHYNGLFPDHFEATYLTPETAAKKLHEEAGDKHLLFCVHGHNTEARKWLSLVKKVREDGFFKKYYPVPVTWSLFGNMPAYDILGSWAGYDMNKQLALMAGRTMENFVSNVDDELFPRKSLMMHSLANHVVFNVACRNGIPKVQFDNIFMVGADVPFDIFQKNPKENYWFEYQREIWGNKTQKASNLIGMLTKGPDNKTPKGKVVVTYTIHDGALQASNMVNRGDSNRLGRVSAGGKYIGRWWWTSSEDKWGRDDNEIHKDFRAHVRSVESTECARASGGTLRHNYHFGRRTVENVYDQYALKD